MDSISISPELVLQLLGSTFGLNLVQLQDPPYDNENESADRNAFTEQNSIANANEGAEASIQVIEIPTGYESISQTSNLTTASSEISEESMEITYPDVLSDNQSTSSATEAFHLSATEMLPKTLSKLSSKHQRNENIKPVLNEEGSTKVLQINNQSLVQVQSVASSNKTFKKAHPPSGFKKSGDRMFAIPVTVEDKSLKDSKTQRNVPSSSTIKTVPFEKLRQHHDNCGDTAKRRKVTIQNFEYKIPPDHVKSDDAKHLLEMFDRNILNMPLKQLCALWDLDDIYSKLVEHKINNINQLIKVSSEDINLITDIVGHRIVLRDLISFIKSQLGFCDSPAGTAKRSEDVFAAPKEPKFPDLRSFLSSIPEGKAILAYYNVKGAFDNSKRNELVKIIILQALQRGISINSCFFEVMSSRIAVAFPNEEKETYYTPPAKEGEKTQRAGGKFVTRKQQIFKALETPTEALLEEDTEEVELELDENQELARKWLIQGRHPETMVRDHWERCFSLRKKTFASAKTIEEVVGQYPILRTYLGGCLLTVDFEKLWPGKLNNFYMSFPALHSKIDQLLDTLKDTESKEKVKIYRNTSDEETKNLMLAFLLASLLPTNYRVNGNWRPSVKDSIDGFILHAQISDLPGASIIKASEDDIVVRYETIKIGSARITMNTVLVGELEGKFVFRGVVHMLYISGVYLFVCKRFTNVLYDSHIDSYVFENENGYLEVVQSSDICFYPNRIHTMCDGRRALRTKY